MSPDLLARSVVMSTWWCRERTPAGKPVTYVQIPAPLATCKSLCISGVFCIPKKLSNVSPALRECWAGPLRLLQPSIRCYDYRPSLSWGLPIASASWSLLISRFNFFNPMDCSLPGSSVHGILQARMLECVAMPSSRASFSSLLK